jgi:hypothetical protein
VPENKPGTDAKIVKFDDVVEQVKRVTVILDDPDVPVDPGQFERHLWDYAPSIIGKSSESVTLEVRPEDPNWTEELAGQVREHIANFKDSDGKPGLLTVVHPKEESAAAE